MYNNVCLVKVIHCERHITSYTFVYSVHTSVAVWVSSICYDIFFPLGDTPTQSVSNKMATADRKL